MIVALPLVSKAKLSSVAEFLRIIVALVQASLLSIVPSIFCSTGSEPIEANATLFALLENHLFVIRKSTLNCWDRMGWCWVTVSPLILCGRLCCGLCNILITHSSQRVSLYGWCWCRSSACQPACQRRSVHPIGSTRSACTWPSVCR